MDSGPLQSVGNFVHFAQSFREKLDLNRGCRFKDTQRFLRPWEWFASAAMMLEENARVHGTNLAPISNAFHGSNTDDDTCILLFYLAVHIATILAEMKSNRFGPVLEVL
ncbi:hypothetical protein RJ640_014323 [Escallonia rubra]|uniref:Uncharacterized protein n=1 Tax=Escallonia rubra TaxID=112253 RepID=A0AA88R8T3_9ASTE|nr:hypothetical protein RJ640_014323 [Escallonia rubra]